ncbi:hypothetical protein [Bradyrhizobium mercantei]|uniref:hypothetical protein n=1 Tax=Bradyrhizobium mercantei TaxID=1904807 RepID=UPI00097843A4|nr:hypothetical protein [Bradyrhizobium mercantei]
MANAFPRQAGSNPAEIEVLAHLYRAEIFGIALSARLATEATVCAGLLAHSAWIAFATATLQLDQRTWRRNDATQKRLPETALTPHNSSAEPLD